MINRYERIIAKRYLSKPVTHSVDSVEAPVAVMVHHVFAVGNTDKPAVVRELAEVRQALASRPI